MANDPTGLPLIGGAHLVGQPLVSVEWFPTVVANCNCSDPPTTLLLIGAYPSTCPKCKKTYVIGGIQYELNTPPKIILGMVTAMNKNH